MNKAAFSTKEEYLEYVQSEGFDVLTRPNRAVAYSGADPDGVENWLLADFASGDVNYRKSSDYDKLEKTPGGKFLHENLRNSGLSKMEQKEIWQEASSKYIREASGNLTCYVQNAREDSVFRQTELPQSLSNEKITSLNGISKTELVKGIEANATQKEIQDHVFGKLEESLRPRQMDSFSEREKRDVAGYEAITGKKHSLVESGQGVLFDKVAVAGEDYARLESKETGGYTLVRWQKGMEKHRGDELTVQKETFESTNKLNNKQIEKEF